MATFTNASELDDPTSSSAVMRTAPWDTPGPIFRPSAGTTLSPGQAAILEMHKNSQTNALIYIAVVLGLYVLGVSIVVIKYIRTERYEARLTRLFHNLMQRDPFFRLSRRRSSLPKCIPVPETGDQAPEEDHPLSHINLALPLPLPVPEIHLSLDEEEESKV